MTWAELTAKPAFRELSLEGQYEARQRWFWKYAAPQLEEPDKAWQQVAASPLNTGQGYAASLLNAAGRGLATTFTAPIAGIGAIGESLGIPGSESMREFGDDLTEGANRALPVNPANEGVGTHLMSGAGQGVGLLATGGAIGLAGKGLGMTAASAGKLASGTMMSVGVASGASEGGEMADRQELDGMDRVIAVMGTGALEYLTEKLPFGMLAETKGIRRMLGDNPGKAVSASGTMVTNTLEEVAANTGQNAMENVLAKPGAETPGLMDNTVQAALGGLGGGIVFAGANAMSGNNAPQSSPSELTPQDAATPSPAADPLSLPPPITIMVDGRLWDRDENGVWSAPANPAETSLANDDGNIVLDPTDPVAGNLIPRLNAMASQAEKLRQQQQPQQPPAADPNTAAQTPAPATSPSPTPQTIPETPEIAAARKALADAQERERLSRDAVPGVVTVDMPAIEAREEAQRQLDALLVAAAPPSPEPGAAIDQAATNTAPPIETGTQSPGQTEVQDTVPSENPAPAGETVSGQPPARPRPNLDTLTDPTGGTDLISTIQGEGLRLGEPQDTAEWEWYRQLEQEAATSLLRPQSAQAAARRGEIDDPKALLYWVRDNLLGGNTTIGEATDILNANHNGNIPDAGALGPALLTAIDSRAQSRSQADPTTELEREQIALERAAKRKVLVADSLSDGQETSVAELAAQVTEGTTLQLAGKPYTVLSADPESGDLVIADDDGNPALFEADETLHPENLADLTSQQDDNMPFSLAPESIPNEVWLQAKPALDQFGSINDASVILASRNPEVPRPIIQAAVERAAGLNNLPVTSTPMRSRESILQRMEEVWEQRTNEANRIRSHVTTTTGNDQVDQYLADKLQLLANQIESGTAPGDTRFLPIYRSDFARNREAYQNASDQLTALRDTVDWGSLQFSYGRSSNQTLHSGANQADDVTPSNPSLPVQALPTDPASRIEAISAALRRATGLRRLPSLIQILHATQPVTLDDGSQRQWQARVRSGRIEINAANITSEQEAIWNLEHELGHEAFRSPTPALKRAWQNLTKALSAHPGIRAEVEALRYTPDQLTEEQAVRLAQKLDTQGPWSAAWAALKEALYDFLTGNWGSIGTRFTDQVSAALAARSIMADARRRLHPDPSNPEDLAAYLTTPEAAANTGTYSSENADIRYSFAPEQLDNQPTPTGRAQPLNAPVLTPDGWRSIGELTVGDIITSHQGTASTVTGVFPQGRKQVFKITLEDGRTVRATADHLWLALNDQRDGIMTTQHLINHIARGRTVKLPVMRDEYMVG